MTRMILVDDHKLFSDGLRKLLEESGHFQVLEQFQRGDLLLEKIFDLKPELLVMDIEILGDLDGIEVLRRIRLKNKTIKVVLLSMHEESIYSREVLEAGGNGYLTKSIDSPLLIQNLVQVVNGQNIFPENLAPPAQEENSILSRQEKRILKLIAEGKTSEQIAAHLGISGLTVKVHRRNMMKKLGAESSAELISLCFSKGIL